MKNIIQGIDLSQTQQFITQDILMATCFDSIESSSGFLKNRFNVSKFVAHSGIPNMFGIPECTKNFDTLDLFFRRPNDDSKESKHVAIRISCVINCCV